MSEWIEHNGSECPVAWGTFVDVQFRNGTTYERAEAGTWGGRTPRNEFFNPYSTDSWIWEGETELDHGGDIVAYRISEPSA